MVEFALSLLLILMLIFGIMEMCSFIYTYTVMADAANEGVRYAIVHTGDSTGTTSTVQTYAAYSLHDVSAMTVSVTCPDTGGCAVSNRVVVTVSYNYVPYLSLFTFASAHSISAYAHGRIVY